jgi:predicted lipoprotein with Yx(FWY)xxD motif
MTKEVFMRTTLILATGAAGLFLLAACGSAGGSASGSGSSSGPSAGAAPAHGTVHVASTSLGKVLVDGSGHTLYLLTADKPGKSTCDASCQAYWPTVKPVSGTSIPGVTAKVGQTSTPGGTATLTVGGWPAYTFVQDAQAGDTHGQGVKSYGGTWWVISPSGKPVTGSGSSSGSGGGTGY